MVVPVHNQGEYIGAIASDYLAVLANLSARHELILVTNACTDASVAVCASLAAAHEQVELIELAQGGWGRAVKAGLRHATGDVLCYTNSARTSAANLALMLSYSLAYPEVVLKANRRIRDNWRRRLGSLVYNLECRALFDIPAWDINGTPKIFPRGFDRLLELRRDDDLVDAEFNWICRREGYPLIEVPMLATTRLGGRSTTNYRSAVRMYWGVYRMRRAGP
ncbi:MAG: glycosyltransferase [Actinomycetota bacterium]|nr:glycosyltransferase [Actinomycetota bacterium]